MSSRREELQQDRSRSRRTDESHRHHKHEHRQPRYLAPESAEYNYRPRRYKNESGDVLTRIHSRPEDYKGKKPSGNMVEYICFDGQDGPLESEGNTDSYHQAKEENTPLGRHDSNSSESSVRTDDSGYDSEDELTLPSTYHHDVAHRGHEHDDWPSHKQQKARKDSGYESGEECSRKPKTHRYDPRGQQDEPGHPYGPDHQHCEGDNSERRCRSSSQQKNDNKSSHNSPSSHHSDPDSGYHSSSPPTSADLIKMVAKHLQSHKEAYRHGDKGQRVNELLGEVVRKVEDGGLNENMIKDIVREVQHVL